MKRFIDIRNQGTGYRFAFWDTISDKFDVFGGNYAWTNWDDFSEHVNDYDRAERYRYLCPSWAFDDEEDDLNSFLEG